MGGISIWQLLILLAVVVLIFGTKKLRGMGGDLGTAVRGFKKAMKGSDENASDDKQDHVIESSARDGSDNKE